MARTTFSGPVKSDNGFEGNVTGTASAVAGTVAATTLSASSTVTFTNLPTSDPAVAGRLWNNAGVLTVSAG